MRKIIALIAAFFMILPLSACGTSAASKAMDIKAADVVGAEMETMAAETAAMETETAAMETENTGAYEDDHTETYDSVCVDVSVHEDGFYSLISNVEIHYYDGGIGYISINDPTLLAFQVSSIYKGGVWMLDLDEGQTIMDELTDVSETLKEQGDSELAGQIENLIEIMSRSGPFTNAST